MKKTYIAPKFTVVELETESIIANSLRLGIDPDAPEVNTDDGVGIGGSRSTLWGED